jgi:hypothetical protein
MSVASDAYTQSITLLDGALSAQAPGEFTQENERTTYTVSANAGETLIVNIIPVTPELAMAGAVAFPGGGQTGGPGGVIVSQVLAESGTCTIQAFQHTMASNLDQGDFVVEVVLLPAWLTSSQG